MENRKIEHLKIAISEGVDDENYYEYYFLLKDLFYNRNANAWRTKSTIKAINNLRIDLNDFAVFVNWKFLPN